MAGIWISLNVSYYTLFIWLPGVVALGERALDPYAVFALIAVAQFPGYLAALLLVDVWGRKRTLATFLALGALAAYVFAVADSVPVYLASVQPAGLEPERSPRGLCSRRVSTLR